MKTSEPPLVSVVIPTRDRPDDLLRAVQSVMAQIYARVEIIVVNDGGADVSGLLNGLQSDFSVRYLRLPENRGRSYARNQGLEAAQGDYIAYLDDDDRYYPNHVKTLVAALADGEHQVAYADSYRVVLRRLPDGSFQERGREVGYSEEFDADRLLWGNYIPILCLMHARSCLEVAGGFDASLHTHEDWDLWIRLSRSFAFRHVPRVTSEYAWREERGGPTAGVRTDFLTTRELIYRRYAGYAMNKPHILAMQAAILKGEREALDRFLKAAEQDDQ